MKFSLFAAFLIFLPANLFAAPFNNPVQKNARPDSLIKALANNTNDKDKVRLLIHLVRLYSNMGDYVRSIALADKGLELSEHIGNGDDISAFNMELSRIYLKQSKNNDALHYAYNALKAINAKDKIRLIEALNTMGNAYLYADPDSANPYFEKALTLAGSIKDSSDRVISYTGIGLSYFNHTRYDSAIAWFKKAIAINNVADSQRLSGVFLNIGATYQDWNKPEKSMAYLRRTMNIDKKYNKERELVVVYVNMAGYYSSKSNFTKQMEYLKKTMKIAKKINQLFLLKMASGDIGNLYRQKGDYRTALKYFNESYGYQDSLTRNNGLNNLREMQLKYEYKAKQAADNAEQDKRYAIAEEGKRKQTLITWLIAGGLLLALVFAGFIFRSLRLTRKQKQVIEVKNKEILDSITYAKRLQDAILPPISEIKRYFPESFVLYKPKDIVAGDFYWVAHPQQSYARPEYTGSMGREKEQSDRDAQIVLPDVNTYLQRAVQVLPTEQPKVASESHLGGAVFIAACDCTGHGVPGALVSVVCSDALNRAVKEFKITEPGKILDKVLELVLETFEKSGDEVKDGMDISLASLSPSEGGIQIQWAGAFNPLLYVKNGEMKEIAADKQPIGKTDNPKPFTTHTIQIQASPPSKGGSCEASLNTPSECKLEAGACLYLFTDGYADQFGGPKGKKFKYKKLENLLLANASATMDEQKQILEETLENWKGDLEQVDDILIIGIRV